MTEKTRILDSLNEHTLLLPSLVNMALAANDRVKYRFTLLQTARSHAERPEAPSTSLHSERMAAGVQNSNLDQVVGGSMKVDGGRYRIPKSHAIILDALSDVAEMLEPLRTAEMPESEGFARRLQAFAMPEIHNDELASEAIHAITSGDRAGGDSLHLLVMDMHRALNALQTSLAGETIDGCHTYGIRDADRPLIAAFMAGVNRTAPLKFDHPGLSATATRVADKLVLQNDIGTTDAHVLVIHVTSRTVTVTYTDVHLPRLLFFQSLFEEYDVDWQDTRSRTDAGMEDGVYHLCVGSYTAPANARLRAYLDYLGSRLVFLIDWNRARKRLRRFVRRKTAIELLKWAADENIGHMAWLKAGGEQLIFDAMSFAYGGQLKPGDRLDDLLTEPRAVQFLRYNLKQALDGLSQGRPASLIGDEIPHRTGVTGTLHRGCPAGYLARACGSDCRTGGYGAGYAGGGAGRTSAGRFPHGGTGENLGDRRRRRTEQGPQHPAGGRQFHFPAYEQADDIADDLEEAVFHITLSPRASSDSIAALSRLVDPVSSASRAFVKALAASRHARRGVAREDIDDFLRAVHAIRTMEHASDQAEREVKRTLARGSQAYAEVFGIVEAARNLEEAADGLMHVALLLRDHVMGKVINA